MIKELIKLANELDRKGLMKEADILDEIIVEDSAEDAEDADKKCPKIKAMADDAVKMVMERVEITMSDDESEEFAEHVYNKLKDCLDSLEEDAEDAHKESGKDDEEE